MSEKIKVLQVTSGLGTVGTNIFPITVMENLDKHKYKRYFFITCDNKQFYEERVVESGVEIIRGNELNGLKNKLKHFFNLIKILKKEDIDVMHTHMDFFNGINLLAAFLAKTPIRVCHSHNTESNRGYTKKNYILIIYRFFMRVLINTFSTDKLGCSDEANKFMYGKKYNDDKFIFNGVDLQRFKNNSLLKRDKLINFITIGRMSEQKNSLFLLNIMKELKILRDDFILYWVGNGPLMNKIKEQIKIDELYNNIMLLGMREDIPILLNKSDFMILPSKWEGLPITLIEAQASNIPCFISDTITDDVNLGLCTKISLKYTAKQWAKKINDFINNKTYNNSLDLNKLNQFDIKNTVRQIEKIYSKLD